MKVNTLVKVLAPVVFISQALGLCPYKIHTSSSVNINAKLIRNFKFYGSFALILNVIMQIYLMSYLFEDFYYQVTSGSFIYSFDFLSTISVNAIIHLETLKHRSEICGIADEILQLHLQTVNIQKKSEFFKSLYLFNFAIIISYIILSLLVTTLDWVFNPYDEKYLVYDSIYYFLCEAVPGAYCCHFSCILYLLGYYCNVLNDYLKEGKKWLADLKTSPLRLIKNIRKLDNKLNNVKDYCEKAFSMANHANILMCFVEILEIAYLQATSDFSIQLLFIIMIKLVHYSIKLFLLIGSSCFIANRVSVLKSFFSILKENILEAIYSFF